VIDESASFPVRVTPYFDSLADPYVDDPISRQYRYSHEETLILPYELEDPLGEAKFMPVPRLIHRYRNRALLLVTGRCAMHCRYCFRRHFAGQENRTLSQSELTGAAEYLRQHDEIDELLLSGGDPLTLDDDNLAGIIGLLREKVPGLVLRLCTRVPGVLPSRITPKLCDILAAATPIWIVAQFNHPRELSAECAAALGRLIDSGLPVVSQTVLLRGVNDDSDVLEDLFNGLVKLRVKPYYLFQPDLVQGTSHFRVPLVRSLAIVRELKEKISRLALPVFAVDIPDGGGKVSLDKESYPKDKDGNFILSSENGVVGMYPNEEKHRGKV
jgi:lysine 2,3-aminomutase